MATKKTFLEFFSLFLLFIAFTPKVFAATMEVIPSTKDVKTGESFSVPFKIDGEGTAFNAAKAKVFISPNLKVNNLTLGNCNFAYVVTPTASNPSFVGVMLGSSSTSCTVYTLDLIPLEAGTGNIIFSDNSVKSYSGASEILSKTNGGNYAITGTQVSTTNTGGNNSVVTPPTIGSDGIKRYNLTYEISIPDGVSPSDVLISLDSASGQNMTLSPSASDKNKIVVTFSDVPEGVHTITTTTKNGETLATETVNVAGDNREFAIASENAPETIPTYAYIVIAIIAILIIVTVIFGIRYIKGKSNTTIINGKI